MRSTVQLCVVPATAPAGEGDLRAPEDVLAYLFTREATLLSDLADVRRELGEQRRRYATRHRLKVFPSLDTLRRLFRPAASVGLDGRHTR